MTWLDWLFIGLMVIGALLVILGADISRSRDNEAAAFGIGLVLFIGAPLFLAGSIGFLVSLFL